MLAASSFDEWDVCGGRGAQHIVVFKVLLSVTSFNCIDNLTCVLSVSFRYGIWQIQIPVGIWISRCVLSVCACMCVYTFDVCSNNAL